MTNPETGRASRTRALAGKFDVIATHMKRGKTVIIEHKTCDMEIEDPTNDYWLKLRMDNQISQYYLGVQSSGTEVDGCLYDVARRPRHKPKALKTIRKKKAETDEEFAQRKLVARSKLSTVCRVSRARWPAFRKRASRDPIASSVRGP